MSGRDDRPAERRLALPIPLAVLVTLFIQTAAALLWAGAVGARVGQLERDAVTAVSLIERTARLEAQVLAMRETLARIERKLDAAAER